MSTNPTTPALSTIATATSSSFSTPLPKHDPRNAVVGAVLGVFGLILLVGIVLITLRVRKRQKTSSDERGGPFQGTSVWDNRHPATKIVPFGTPGTEGHNFYRPTPGKDMRIAIRRPDGAWDFADPSEPFTPSGVSDLHPSPASSRTTFFSSSKSQKDAPEPPSSAILEYKARESRAAQMIRLGYDVRDDDLEMGDRPLPHPPPAYGQEPTVGPYATYRPSLTRETYHTSVS